MVSANALHMVPCLSQFRSFKLTCSRRAHAVDLLGIAVVALHASAAPLLQDSGFYWRQVYSNAVSLRSAHWWRGGQKRLLRSISTAQLRQTFRSVSSALQRYQRQWRQQQEQQRQQGEGSPGTEPHTRPSSSAAVIREAIASSRGKQGHSQHCIKAVTWATFFTACLLGVPRLYHAP